MENQNQNQNQKVLKYLAELGGQVFVLVGSVFFTGCCFIFIHNMVVFALNPSVSEDGIPLVFYFLHYLGAVTFTGIVFLFAKYYPKGGK